MRYGFVIPTGDPQTVADLAHQADTLDLSDGVVHRHLDLWSRQDDPSQLRFSGWARRYPKGA